MVELSTQKALFTFGLGAFSKMATIIKNTQNLPQKPNYFIKLLKLAYNAKSSRSEFSAELSKDKELISKVLNLPSLPGKQAEMSKEAFDSAVKELEKSFIESLLEVDFAKKFHKALTVHAKPEQVTKFNKSVKAAIIASNVSKWVNYEHRELAFFATLLADMPVMVLATSDSEARAKVELMVNDGMSEKEAEMVAHGFDHGEFGAKLFQYYSMPNALVDLMQNHYQADKTKDKVLTKVVNFSRFIAECFSDKTQSPSSIWTESQQSIQDLGLQVNSEEWGNKISLLFVKSIEFEMRVIG